MSDVREKPILFSGPMVRAILEGRKTQTRRVLGKTGRCNIFDGTWTDDYVMDPGNARWREECTPYRVGDRLWVREAWRADDYAPDDPERTIYRADMPADGLTDLKGIIKWKPGIHMHRARCRLTLAVTAVRVERLLDISEEDARAEGFADGPLGPPVPETPIGDGWTISSPGCWASAAGHFQVAWSELHPEWDGFWSPWVVAVTFAAEINRARDEGLRGVA